MKTLRIKLFLALALAVAGGSGFAQTNKNIPGSTDYAAFTKFVTERNIFDPSRVPHYTSSGRATQKRTTRTRVSNSAPAFTLVGTMSYEKGMFAFFNGNNEELKKALTVGKSVAGYTVTDIAHSRVMLESADKKEQVELKVGDVMREENGKWHMTGAGEVTGTSGSAGAGGASSSSGSAAPAASSSASEPNEVLKRLMEKREQESK